MKALYNMLEGFNHGSDWIETILKMITAAITFTVSTMENCNTHRFIYDAITFCFKGQCSGFAAITNAISHQGDIIIAEAGIL
jgi:hypothetical protein